jgi:hypothetical protein
MFLADGTKIQNIEAYLSRQRASPKALYREDGTAIEHPSVFLAILRTQWAKAEKAQSFLARKAIPEETRSPRSTICKFFASNRGNRCKHGDNCRFSHDDPDARPRCTTSHSTSVTQLAIKH